MADDMGLLRTDVEIESPLQEGDRRLLRDVLVDTGAELSWARHLCWSRSVFTVESRSTFSRPTARF